MDWNPRPLFTSLFVLYIHSPLINTVCGVLLPPRFYPYFAIYLHWASSKVPQNIPEKMMKIFPYNIH